MAHLASLASPAGRGLRAAELVLFAVLLGWLAWSAAIVDVEYYDGWDAVSNARLFAGTAGDAGYVPNRAPMMSWLLLPGEALRLLRDGDPLDPRPYHVVSAVLHAVYLLGVYWLLCRIRGRTWPTLVAFVVTIPTFLFFAYGPYLSHDVFPGLVLLAMVVLLGRWLTSPSWRLWLALVALGVFAVLIKQTYALFWIVLPLAAVAFRLVPSWRDAAPGVRRIAWLAAGALASGAVTWLVLAGVLGHVRGLDSVPFLERPLIQVSGVSGQAHQFPWWVYLRNAPAFGLLTVLLLLPGAWWSRRSREPAVRLALVSLPLFLLGLQLIPYREVRYLIFLAPLAAVLVEPAVRRALVRRSTTLALVAVLVVECLPPFPWPRLPEATRLAQPFYRHSELREFVGAVRTHRTGPVVWEGRFLGFRPEPQSRLVGDRHNEIFHFGPHHLLSLERLGTENFVRLPPDQQAQAVPPGTVVLASNNSILNLARWTHAARQEPPGLEQSVAVGVGLFVQRTEAGWLTPDGRAVAIGRAAVRPEGRGEGAQVLSGEVLRETLANARRPRILIGRQIAGELRPLNGGTYAVAEATARRIQAAPGFLVVAQEVVYRQSYVAGVRAADAGED